MSRSTEAPISSVRGLINVYKDAVRAEIVSSDPQWITENGWRFPFADPNYAERAQPPILVLSASEQSAARRGLWKHLNIIRAGILKHPSANEETVAYEIVPELYEVDGYTADSLTRIETLHRAYNRDEREWLGEVALGDHEIIYKLAEIAFARRAEKTGQWHTRRSDIRTEKVRRIMSRYEKRRPADISKRLDYFERGLQFRKWWWGDQIRLLTPDVKSKRANLAMVKVAEELLSVQVQIDKRHL